MVLDMGVRDEAGQGLTRAFLGGDANNAMIELPHPRWRNAGSGVQSTGTTN